jgi:hypothetical protein
MTRADGPEVAPLLRKAAGPTAVGEEVVVEEAVAVGSPRRPSPAL